MKKYTLLYSLLMLLLVSCNHKELCEHYPHRAKIRVNVDWSEFSEEQPTGMTLMVYPSAGGKPQTTLSNTLSHVYVNLEAGHYHTLMFNQSVSEFGSFTFRDMDVWEKAEVISATASSRWYKSRSEGERVATEPEWLGIDSDGEVEVTDEMAETSYPHMGSDVDLGEEYVIATHMPRNIIYTLHVRVHVKGVHNLRSARAALEGMSEGVMFSTLQRSDVTVTQLLETWKLTVDKDDPTRGYIDATIKCFGLPHSHQGLAEENLLTVSMLLVDNKTQVNYPVYVGHLIEADDHGRLVLYLEIDLIEPLPDVKPEGGSSSGFDATVEDWGEEIEHEIVM